MVNTRNFTSSLNISPKLFSNIGNGFKRLGSGLKSLWNDFSGVTQTRETNALNQQLNAENLAYQKEYNAQVFAREDNANQRALADMRAAGLNPLSSALSSGYSTSSSAPQNTFDYDSPSRTGLDSLASLMSLAQGFQSLKSFNADIDFKRLNNESLALDNEFKQRSLNSRVNSQFYNEADMYHNLVKKAYDSDYQHFYNIHDGDSENLRIAKIVAKHIGLPIGSDNQFSPSIGFASVRDGSISPFNSDSGGYGNYPQPRKYSSSDIEPIMSHLKGYIPESILNILKTLVVN